MLISILLLFAIVAVSMPMRNYQNNLMRVFGASIAQLKRILVIEFILLGLVAGVIGAAGSLAIAYYVASKIFQISYSLNWMVILIGGLIGIAGIMLVGGLLGTRSALKTAPIQLLRNMH